MVKDSGAMVRYPLAHWIRFQLGFSDEYNPNHWYWLETLKREKWIDSLQRAVMSSEVSQKSLTDDLDLRYEEDDNGSS